GTVRELSLRTFLTVSALDSGSVLVRFVDRIRQELTRAARMYRRFYRGHFLGADFCKRTEQISRRSRTVRSILGNLIIGNQSYLTLKKHLVFSIPSIGIDLITGRSELPIHRGEGAHQ